MLNIALIGCGYWGGNFLRLVQNHPKLNLKYICETNLSRIEELSSNNPDVIITKVLDDVICDKDVDCVIITAPSSTHYQIAKKFLQNGKHVLCEKPMTVHNQEAEELFELAKENNIQLMVGYTYLYNQSIKDFKKIFFDNFNSKEEVTLELTRKAPGPIRTDVNIIADLAPHDISIIKFLFDKPEIDKVKLFNTRYGKNESLDEVSFSFNINNYIKIVMHFSWDYPEKKRTIIAKSKSKELFFDDLNQSEIDIITSDETLKHHVEVSEPLKLELNSFLDLIEEGNNSMSFKNTKFITNMLSRFNELVG